MNQKKDFLLIYKTEDSIFKILRWVILTLEAKTYLPCIEFEQQWTLIISCEYVTNLACSSISFSFYVYDEFLVLFP